MKLLIAKFKDFFEPALTLAYQEFQFGTRDQTGEDFTVWLTELQALADNFEFGELKERMRRKQNNTRNSRPETLGKTYLGKSDVQKNSRNLQSSRTR